MIFKYLVVGVSLLALSGCAGADYSNYALSMDQTNQSSQQMVSSYFDKRAADNAMVMKALTSGGPENAQNNQMAVVLYTILSQQQDEKVLATFRPVAPTKPTTDADMGLAFMNNTLPTVVKVAAGAWLGSELIDGLGQGVVLGSGASYIKGSNVLDSHIQSPVTTTTYNTDHSVSSVDNSVGAVDSSVGAVDNSVGAVDNSNSSTNPVDNSNSSTNPVDNSNNSTNTTTPTPVE